ncbi:MAG TPA: orotidine-5'-phosphate decarboxylase [Actinomycetota bacterium]|jgi:orotidine-5'-phosphate decarboxylase
MSPNPLIVAADVSDVDAAGELARRLSGVVSHVKVGLELFVSAGPPAVERLREHAPVFLDLKLHDIPNTVGRAARAAARLGPAMISVHALGGMAMVRAAVEGAAEGADERGLPPPDVVAVTVLSSLAGEGLASPASLAFEAISAGAGGAVVSGEDVKVVREAVGEAPVVVVPGIRPKGQPNGDQVRVLTPVEALEAGADYLVVGRPIVQAPDPVAAARSILSDLGVAEGA